MVFIENTFEKFKEISAPMLKIFIFTFIFVYFGYHLISGQNGVLNYFKQQAKLEQMQSELEIVEKKRTSLSNKVKRLYPSSLDADLLDEQYRRTTGKIKSDEVIYYID